METSAVEESKKAQECCPPFNPDPWNEKMIFWDNKQFIRDRVFTFYYMPINFGSVMKRMRHKVESAGVQMRDWMVLSDHKSKWNMEVLLEVDRKIPDADNVSLSGTFFSKVYEGPYSDTSKWTVDYEETVNRHGLKVNKWHMWYTTCPKCAKKYGKNYTVIIDEVSAS